MLTYLCSKLQAHMHTGANSHYMSQPVSYGQYESQHTNVQRWLPAQDSFDLPAISL